MEFCGYEEVFRGKLTASSSRKHIIIIKKKKEESEKGTEETHNDGVCNQNSIMRCY